METINAKKTKKLVKSLFADWKKGEIPVHNLPKPENVPLQKLIL